MENQEKAYPTLLSELPKDYFETMSLVSKTELLAAYRREVESNPLRSEQFVGMYGLEGEERIALHGHGRILPKMVYGLMTHENEKVREHFRMVLDLAGHKHGVTLISLLTRPLEESIDDDLLAEVKVSDFFTGKKPKKWNV
jgi:hypothetical protein